MRATRLSWLAAALAFAAIAMPAHACDPPPVPERPPTAEVIRAGQVAYQQHLWKFADLVFAAEVDPAEDRREARVRPVVLAKGNALPKRFTIKDRPYEPGPCGELPGFTMLLDAGKDATYLVYARPDGGDVPEIFYALAVDELVDPVALAAVGRR